MSFNLSHRNETAVIALSTGSPIGVDIETPALRSSPYGLAARFFHPEEAATIEELGPALATSTFVRYWTAKEAVLKALGTGLSRSPGDVVISLDPRKRIRLREVPGPWRPATWTLHELGIAQEHLTLTLAVPMPNVRLAGVHAFPSAPAASA